jgi:pimeloyl-ACP methyl ester carboxylesterase
VLQAMREAGIQPGEDVMLMGHSQGGITAMALAADDAVRAEFDVTTVFTGGSPAGRFDLPDRTTVTQDLASDLAAEDRAGWRWRTTDTAFRRQRRRDGRPTCPADRPRVVPPSSRSRRTAPPGPRPWCSGSR